MITIGLLLFLKLCHHWGHWHCRSSEEYQLCCPLAYRTISLLVHRPKDKYAEYQEPNVAIACWVWVNRRVLFRITQVWINHYWMIQMFISVIFAPFFPLFLVQKVEYHYFLWHEYIFVVSKASKNRITEQGSTDIGRGFTYSVPCNKKKIPYLINLEFLRHNQNHNGFNQAQQKR